MTPLASVPLLAVIVVFLPLPWHWRHGNVATLSLIAWLFVTNLIEFVNATIWQNNTDIHAVIWCDIATHTYLGAQVALPAASLCLCIRVFKAAAAKGLKDQTLQSIRRRTIIELGICFGLPLIYVASSYIVQGHRFNIIKTLGCRGATYNTVISIFIVDLPPMLCSVAATVYAVLAMIYLRRHYHSFVENLKHADTHRFALSHYYRLLAMAIVVTIWMNAVTAFVLITNIKLGTNPYISWYNVHADFSRIVQYDLSTGNWTYVFIGWYSLPVSTFLFVILFSFGEDAVAEYRRVLTGIYTFMGVPRLLKWLGARSREKDTGSRTEPERSEKLESLRFHRSPQASMSGASHITNALRSTSPRDEAIKEIFREANRSNIGGAVYGVV